MSQSIAAGPIWNLELNPDRDLPTYQYAFDYLKTTDGFSTALQVFHDTIELGNEMGRKAGFDSSKTFTQLETDLGTALSVLPIVRLPASSMRAVESLTDGSGEINTVKSIAECLSDSSWTVTLFTQHPLVRFTAQFMDFAAHGLDLPITGSNYWKASVLESCSSGEVKVAFAHSKNCYLLGLAKDISFLVGAIFAFAIFLTGVPVISAIGFAVFSLASAMFGMLRDIQTHAGKYHVIAY